MVVLAPGQHSTLVNDTRMHPHWLVFSGVQLLENAAMLVAVNIEEQQALGCSEKLELLQQTWQGTVSRLWIFVSG